MKNIICSLLLLVGGIVTVSAQDNATSIELSENQSMCITGKGPGQDGAINPYANDKRSFAVVENTGDSALDIRISRDEGKVEIITVEAKKTVQVELKKNHVLYLDSTKKGVAKISFKPYQV